MHSEVLDYNRHRGIASNKEESAKNPIAVGPARVWRRAMLVDFLLMVASSRE